MIVSKTSGSLLFVTLLITACGGGSSGSGNSGGGEAGGGNIVAATAPTVDIDNDNSLDLAVAATEGAGEALSSDGIPSTTPLGKRQNGVETNLPFTSRERQVLQCSDLGAGTGTAVFDFSDDFRTFSIVYGCTTISGSFSGAYIPDAQNWTSFTASYDDFRVEGSTIDGSISCTRSSTTSIDIACAYGFSGIDGLNGGTYSIANSKVSGDNTSGYTMSATVTDSSAGAVDYSATNLIFGDCEYGVPSSGVMTIMGTNGTQAAITYIDCNSFSIALGTGSVITYQWSDVATVTP